MENEPLLPIKIDATFKFLKQQASDADFVIYTGDSARHVSAPFIYTRTQTHSIKPH